MQKTAFLLCLVFCLVSCATGRPPTAAVLSAQPSCILSDSLVRHDAATVQLEAARQHCAAEQRALQPRRWFVTDNVLLVVGVLLTGYLATHH